MILKLHEWLHSISESLTLSQFNISQEIKFQLKEKFNFDESTDLEPIDILSKKQLQSFIKENSKFNLFFGYNDEVNLGIIIHKDILFPQNDYFSILAFKDNLVKYESIDSLQKIIKVINQDYKYYVSKNTILWVDKNNAEVLSKFLTQWIEILFAKFNTFIDRYYSNKKEEIKEKFKNMITQDNIETLNQEILSIDNYQEDSKLYKRYVINNKSNLLYFISKWIKNNYSEYKNKESILYYSSIIKELNKAKGKDQLIKDFIFHSVTL